MLLFFGGGILAHALPSLQPLAFAITTPLLLLTNAAVLFALFDDHDERAGRLRWWCLGAWTVTLTLEIVGVATGAIFGPYHYGATLRGQVADVPLLIGLNWVTLLLGALTLANRLPGAASAAGAVLTPLAGAILLTAFDWLMEPVAVALGYWHWHTWPAIPTQNYVAWFLIALGLGSTLRALRLQPRTGLAGAYFLVQAGFFVALRLVLPLVAPGA